jgi:GTPase SAR1 family protein
MDSNREINQDEKKENTVTHKVVILGDIGVGKSSIAQRYILYIYKYKYK